ncbi:uncharacterized protein DUF4783 [Balneicella halophila]|uniref:Uncharacterized protein DUF4783 n=1 Tax=Balneicella halophila TaxID=1537566 RepID=A0A7L4URT9_BALHA|nr:DUF4783 domain-containing protein [Balneicella halophila]PVX52369.1 uncharacterized protein DUF4783 [Balneicella halophila]
MRKIIIITTIVLLAVVVPAKGNLPAGIATAFKSGNADKVATYFEATVEMAIDGKRTMYSKAQATQVLSDFFKANKPSNLVEKHNGGSGNSQFSVFTFSSNSSKFRATIFYKGKDNDLRISKVNIEKDTGF